MPPRPTLPIDEMSDEDFDKFKKDCLDDYVLDNDTLKAISALFGVGKPETGSICCNDYHQHSYRCVYFNHPVTGIVDRLLWEINNYRNKLEKIKESATPTQSP